MNPSDELPNVVAVPVGRDAGSASDLIRQAHDLSSLLALTCLVAVLLIVARIFG